MKCRPILRTETSPHTGQVHETDFAGADETSRRLFDEWDLEEIKVFEFL